MPDTTEPDIRATTGSHRYLGWLVVGLLFVQPAVAEDTIIAPPDSSAFEPAPMDLCEATGDGYLSGTLFGALSKHLEWHGAEMDCGGMLRPNENGIRLVFAAPRESERLLIMLGIDGQLDDLAGSEQPTNITIIDEVTKRFFSTGGQDRCWSLIESIQPVTDQILQVVGKAYCAGSLPSLSDNSSITLREVQFSGRLELDEAGQD